MEVRRIGPRGESWALGGLDPYNRRSYKVAREAVDELKGRLTRYIRKDLPFGML